MSDVIQLLPDSVANQIAAGEVIQRPASVIKELIENAVDAGATHIHVLVQDAGRTSIQVIDDGKGMSETDARLAFERHATSKIRKADDLFNLHTMGFRGEALPSIVAVSQVELKTRLRGEEIGTHISISGSKFQGQEPCACPEGSNFLIENLFFNTPARRKFLKSNTTELNNIIAAFERIVLVYPNISFTFHSNGAEMFQLRAGGLRQRIVDIFGKRINQDLLPVKVETSVCGINGFVGKPESAKKKGAKQYFFVNGRYMRHPYFSKAIMQAYERLVPLGEQVPFFIYFDVDPKDIDVNIHPTKTEIKFENEQAIFQILMAAVRDAIGKFSNVSTIEFDTEGKPDIPIYNPDNNVEMPHIDYNPRYNPFKSGKSTKGNAPSTQAFSGTAHVASSKLGQRPWENAPHNAAVPSQWEQLYESMGEHNPTTNIFTSKGINANTGTQLSRLNQQTEENKEAGLIEEKSPTHYQYKGRYIMTAVKSGLMIVDQHRAHIRILFEQYQKQMAARKMHSQKILFPESLELTAREMVTMAQVKPELSAMGFELTNLGGNSWSINAIPEGLEGINILKLLHEMLTSAQEKTSSVAEDVNIVLAQKLARAAAIPYGQVLSNEEMEAVVNNLFQCQNFNYTPDGQHIICIIKQHDIEQLLG